MKIFENYPFRMCLDIGVHLAPFIKNKTVCDIGCGAGDLLEYLKTNNLCKEVKGIEINASRFVPDRKYIQLGDVFKVGVPDVDVYILWVGQFPYQKLLNMIKPGKIFILLESAEHYHLQFNMLNKIHLIDTIHYDYDETKYITIDEFNKQKPKGTGKGNWNIKGTRYFKVYKYL